MKQFTRHGEISLLDSASRNNEDPNADIMGWAVVWLKSYIRTLKTIRGLASRMNGTQIIEEVDKVLLPVNLSPAIAVPTFLPLLQKDDHTMTIRFECFGMTILKARAVDFSDIDNKAEGEGNGVLVIELPNEGTINLFMPYSTALEYASAINACNDREAASQAVARQRDYLPELTQTLGEY